MKKIIEDKDFGTITLVKRLNSRNYTIRLNRGKIFISLPMLGHYEKALELLETHRLSLLKKAEEYHSVEKEMPEDEEDELRIKAKSVLPARLKSLAKKHKFSYSAVKISKSRTRWGSCSSQKTINLSFYLMLLPEHLADYVLLHELCHTVHMDHGVEFWKLLDLVTKGRANQLRKELRTYHI